MPHPTVAPLGARFDDVEHIAVLRGGGLGDVLFAVPAMQALSAAYPGARITLLGAPVHRALLDGRTDFITRVEVLPVAEGVWQPSGESEDPVALAAFFDRMLRDHVDLAVQLHGGGRFSNPFLSRLGARHTVGLATPDAPQLDRTLPYAYYQHEMMRALEVVGLAGAAPVTLEPRLTVTVGESAAVLHLVDDARDGLVVIHPGATDPRRRWPVERFAEVAGCAVADGFQVLVVGDSGDVPLVERIVELAGAGVSSLAGRLDLRELAALFTHADVVVGNDSGPRHLAQAVGARTVGVYWVGNLINAGPHGRGMHRAHLGWVVACPTCGRDVTQVGWTSERCEHDDSFVAGVTAAAVYADVSALIHSAG
jgi:ADP-heptose:LPS heptosyltransferase